MITAANILISQVGGKPKYWINQDWIKQQLGLSDEYLWKVRSVYKKSVPPSLQSRAYLPETGKAWRWARVDGRFYYDYDHIPNRAPKYYKAAINLDELTGQNNYQPVAGQITAYIKQYYSQVAQIYPSFTPKDVIMSACAFLFATEHLPKRKQRYFLQEVVKAGYRYLPKTWHTLYKKIRAYQNGSPLTALIHRPREGNANALTYTDAEVEAWTITLRADGRNYTNAHIIRKVQNLCRLYGKPVPSVKWFESFLANYEVKYLTAAGRYGSSRLGNRWDSYLPVAPPMYAGDVWQIDATRLNIIEHKKADGSKGFLFMITVIDVYSGDILGYNFDYQEDRWSVISAVKMAVAEAGYLPYEMVFDRFPGHNSPEAVQLFDELKHLGVKVTFTHKATGKARLERLYDTLQTVFMQDNDYYYGEGIKSRRYYAHRSPEYLKKLRQRANKEKFNLSDAVNEGIRIIETYRQTPYSAYSQKYKHIQLSPAQLHDQSTKANVKPVSSELLYRLFALKKALKLSRNGYIHTQIMKQELIYQTTDYNLISKYERVWVAYMPENLDVIHLYARKNHLWWHLGEARVVDLPQVYGPNAEFDKLAKAKQRLRQLKEQREQALNDIVSQVSEVDLMLGPFTRKADKESSESAFLKAAGDGIEAQKQQNHRHSDDDFDVTDNIIKQL